MLVAGMTGAGKSTFARRLAAVVELPYIELDALYHGPQWVPRPFDAVLREVDHIDLLRFRRPREARAWLRGLSPPTGHGPGEPRDRRFWHRTVSGG